MREERMKTAFTNPGGSFLAYDEAVKAVEGRYSERNLEEQMAEFERERTKTVEFVKSLSEADWGKTAFHPDRGMMTLCEIVHMVVCHDVYHIEQLWAVVD